ncbi:endoglucanase, partial [Methanobrevibacter sp.]|uniref:endoglucanase n=1 Tax=Methanobrevibacter sp. TaxID=66852 RepID=UPI0026E08A7D
MQGKPADNKKKRRSRKSTKNKKKEEQDLVQKYIINPKKGDAKYNKREKSSMDSGTFKLFLLLVLVIAFTAGVAYGIFNFDFDTLSQTNSVAVVQDTAFPEFTQNTAANTTTSSSQTSYTNYSSTSSSSDSSYSNVETTSDSSSSSSYDSGPTSSDSSYSSDSSSSSSDSSYS